MNWESWVIATFSRTLAYGTPLLLATLGEIYAERSGVLNLGVEGMMVIGAFAGFAVAHTSGNPWLGVLIASVVGGIFSLIHAYFGPSPTVRQHRSLKAPPCWHAPA